MVPHRLFWFSQLMPWEFYRSHTVALCSLSVFPSMRLVLIFVSYPTLLLSFFISRSIFHFAICSHAVISYMFLSWILFSSFSSYLSSLPHPSLSSIHLPITAWSSVLSYFDASPADCSVYSVLHVIAGKSSLFRVALAHLKWQTDASSVLNDVNHQMATKETITSTSVVGTFNLGLYTLNLPCFS